MPMTAHRVATNLWVGSAPTTRDDRRAVIDNFDVIVFCAEEFQPKAKLFPGVEVVRCGIDDDVITWREMKLVILTAAYIHAVRGDRERTLVTCWQGRNRSALVAALAMIIGTYTPRQAIATVRERRKIPHVLSNPSFTQFLRDSERHLERWAREV